MRFPRSLGLAWRVGIAVGCVDCGRPNTYAAGGAGIGAAVAGAVLYRTVTGNCVAVCRAGHVCDRESGLCIQAECLPTCTVGQLCVRENDGRFRCIEDALTFSIASARRRAVLDAGLPASDAQLGQVSTDGGASLDAGNGQETAAR